MKLKDHYFLDEERTTVYVYIRKNACSLFKRMILDALPKDKAASNLTDIQMMHRYRAASYREVSRAKRRVFVLRNPIERVVSGFLNQVVLKIDDDYPEMFVEMEKQVEKPRGDVTFEDFVSNYLCAADFSQVNAHFHPVVSHLGDFRYTHVLIDKTMYKDAWAVFGREIADKYFAVRRNDTSKLKSEKTPKAHLISAREILSTYRTEGYLPTKGSFISPDLRVALEKQYAADMTLFSTMMQRRTRRKDAPVGADFREFDFSEIYSHNF